MESTQTIVESEINALDKIRDLIRPCIQCGTCTASCPNADEMDLTPRKMWRLVLMGRLEDVMQSKTFILCSDCYTCTLRCPRGLPLTEAMESLKGIAFDRREAIHRSSSLFYDKFIQSVKRYGRVRELEFMSRYFAAMKNPLTSFRFAPLGIKLIGKGKVEFSFGKSSILPLDALFDKVAALEQETVEPLAKEANK